MRSKRDDDYLPNYAQCLQHLGRHQEALTALEKALKIAPTNADIHLSIADGYRDLGRNNDVVRAYRQFLETDQTGSPMRVVGRSASLKFQQTADERWWVTAPALGPIRAGSAPYWRGSTEQMSLPNGGIDRLQQPCSTPAATEIVVFGKAGMKRSWTFACLSLLLAGPAAAGMLKGEGAGCQDKLLGTELATLSPEEPRYIEIWAQGMQDMSCRGFGQSSGDVTIENREDGLACIRAGDDDPNKPCFWVPDKWLP